MAKKVKKVIKKVKSNIDENRSLYNKILCYIKCYGGYLLAVGAGCTFGVNLWAGLGLIIATARWAYWTTCKGKVCKGGSCKKCV